MDKTKPGREHAFTFRCQNETLIGILHAPDSPIDTAVLVVVGGPQYRIGSHRQFLHLARHLAEDGIPVLRFDYRGMGDSTGTVHNFDTVDDDIRAAIDQLFERCPGLNRVVMWGLCDGASASLIYAHQDPRVAALILLNPWVHHVRSEAKVRLKSYYVSRFFSRGFWKKIIKFKFDYKQSMLDVINHLKNLVMPSHDSDLMGNSGGAEGQHFLPKMLAGMKKFNGKTFILLSGDDLTADEFREFCRSERDWSTLIKNKVTDVHTIKDANHTFSSEAWKYAVIEYTKRCIESIKDKE